MSTLRFLPVAAVLDAAGNAISVPTGPTAAAGGSLVLREATANGVNTMTIQCPALLAANRTITMSDASYTLPAGAANASTLMDLQTVQTVAAVKTFTPGLTFGITSSLTPEAAAASGAAVVLAEAIASGVNTFTIQSPTTLAASRIVSWSDRAYDMANIAARAELITLGAAGVAGSLTLQEDTNNGANTMTILCPAALAGNRTIAMSDASYTLPAGVANASIIQDLESAQTISGAKIFTPGLTFGVTSTLNPATAGAGATLALAEATANGVNTMTLTCPAALAANRTITMADASYTLPAGVANASTLQDLETAQTISGAKIFTPGLTFGVTSTLNPETAGAGATLALAEATANGVNTMTLTCPALLAANRTITMSDASYVLPAGVANASTILDAETAQNISSTKTLVAGGGLNLGSGAGTLGLTGGFFIQRAIAASGGAQTQAHGLGRIPSLFDVVLDGNGAGCLITLVAADINNVTWTTSAAAGTVRVLAM